jgi:intergrase/recombinase
MDKNENFLILLKLFKNRPNHLYEFLIDSDAINKSFLNKLKKSIKIKPDLNEDNLPFFKNLTEMKDYYLSLVDNTEEKTKEEIEEELNRKLNESIKDENYEEACRIRDYMRLNKIRKK